mgnify:FL=1
MSKAVEKPTNQIFPPCGTVKHCDICAADQKPVKPIPRTPMGTIKTGAPFDVIATDYLGP